MQSADMLLSSRPTRRARPRATLTSSRDDSIDGGQGRLVPGVNYEEEGGTTAPILPSVVLVGGGGGCGR